jgi:hypothetical protein
MRCGGHTADAQIHLGHGVASSLLELTRLLAFTDLEPSVEGEVAHVPFIRRISSSGRDDYYSATI